jgi:hypothetical protein
MCVCVCVCVCAYVCLTNVSDARPCIHARAHSRTHDAHTAAQWAEDMSKPWTLTGMEDGLWDLEALSKVGSNDSCVLSLLPAIALDAATHLRKHSHLVRNALTRSHCQSDALTRSHCQSDALTRHRFWCSHNVRGE